ncbi:MAG: hypothetical protein ACTSU0_07080, partial [Alphaproteobacteria bacterium]
DPEDEYEPFFADLDNRGALERLVIEGWRHAVIDRAAIHDMIVNNTPLVSVGLYRDGGVQYVVICDLAGATPCLD